MLRKVYLLLFLLVLLSIQIDAIYANNEAPTDIKQLWTPDELITSLWLDASDTTTITERGGLVSQWNDKSGNGLDVSQGMDSLKPITNSASINGLNVLDFTDDEMFTSSNPFGATVDDAFVISVNKVDSIVKGSLFTLTGSPDSNNRWNAHVTWKDGYVYFDTGGINGDRRVYKNYNTSVGKAEMCSFYGSTTDNAQQIYKNGGWLAGDTSGRSVSTVGNIYVGSDSNWAYQDTSIGEFIVIDGVVGTSDRQKLEGYLAHKWGVTDDLPDDHPYKNMAPVQELTVAENKEIGIVAGILSVTDDDSGDRATYTLVSGDGDTNNASFAIHGNRLKTTESFDYETKDSYSIRIRITDGGGLTYEKALIINIIDRDEAPIGIKLSSSDVTGEDIIGTTVGTLSAIDDDIGDTATYELVSGDGDSGNSSFTINGTSLKTSKLFNYEIKDKYSIRVRAMDSTGLIYEKVLIIQVYANSLMVQDGYGYTGLTSVNPIENPAFTGFDQWPAGTTFQGGSSTPSYGFSGGIYDGKNVWLVPRSSNKFIKVNPVSGEMTGFGDWPAGVSHGSYTHYSGGVFDGTNIWLVPESSNALVRFNTLTGAMKGYNQWPEGISLGGSKFASGIFDGRNIWLVPRNADRIVKVEPSTGNMTGYTFDVSNIGDSAFSGGVFDGTYLWMVPNKSDKIIRVDVSNGELTYLTIPELVIGNFRGGTFDGTYVWFNRGSNDYMLRINPETNEKIYYRVNAENSNRRYAGSIFDGESIWIPPASGGAVKLIKFSPTIGNYTYSSEWPDGFSGDFSSSTTDGNNIWFIPRGANLLVRMSSGITVTYDGNGSTEGSVPVDTTPYVENNQVTVQPNSGNLSKDGYIFAVWNTKEDGTGINYEPTGIDSFNISSENVILYAQWAHISNITMPNAGMKLGDTVTATLTVIDDDGDSYTLKSGTIAGFPLENLTRIDSTTYTVEFTVVSGGADIPEEEDIAVDNIVLRDINGIDYDAYGIDISQDSDLIDINPDAPTDILITNSSIDENKQSGSAIGILSSIDPDIRDTVIYTLESGDGDTDNNSFEIAGTTLKTTKIFDYEIKNIYSIRIRATDGDGLIYEEIITISIIDIGILEDTVPIDDATDVEPNSQLIMNFDGERVIAKTGKIHIVKSKESTNVALGKTSSAKNANRTYSFPPINANDGKPDSYTWINAYYPWWEIDLGNSHYIDSINLICSSQWDVWVFVSEEPFGDASLITLQEDDSIWKEYVHSIPGPNNTYVINAPGRYVRVQENGFKEMKINEVEIYSRGEIIESIAANDTDKVSEAGNTVTVTPIEEFGNVDYHILVDDDAFSNSVQNYKGIDDTTEWNFSVPGISLVSVLPVDGTLKSTETNFTMNFNSDVTAGLGQIYFIRQQELTNVALNKEVTKSSNNDGGKQYAVDGDVKTSTNTLKEANSWVQVDLGDNYDISNINLVSGRTSYWLFVSQEPFEDATFDEIKNNNKIWKVRRTDSALPNYEHEVNEVGRYVRVQCEYTKNSETSVSEIEVYSAGIVDSIIDANNTASVNISGSEVTVDAGIGLYDNSDYYIKVSDNAFKKGLSQYFEGINDSTKWNFIINDIDEAPTVAMENIRDVSNYGDGRDIKVDFYSASDETDVVKYKVYVVPTNNISTFDVGYTETLGAAHCYEVAKIGNGQLHKVRLRQDLLDTNDQMIQNNISYKIVVFSEGTNGYINSLIVSPEEITLTAINPPFSATLHKLRTKRSNVFLIGEPVPIETSFVALTNITNPIIKVDLGIKKPNEDESGLVLKEYTSFENNIISKINMNIDGVTLTHGTDYTTNIEIVNEKRYLNVLLNKGVTVGQNIQIKYILKVTSSKEIMSLGVGKYLRDNDLENVNLKIFFAIEEWWYEGLKYTKFNKEEYEDYSYNFSLDIRVRDSIAME